jgi:hypothetical protein
MKAMKAASLLVLAALSHSATAQVVFHHHRSMAEISGSGWTLRYGVQQPPRFLETSRDRAFFANGRSLRWIDTRQGVVLARWLLPERIMRLDAEDAGAVRVGMANPMPGRSDFHEILLDPENPQLPRLPPYPWSMEQAFAHENVSVTKLPDTRDPRRFLLMIPGVEEMIQRDSLSPWFHYHLGDLLRSTDTARSKAEFLAAAECCRSSSDFLELFALAETLQEKNEAEASEAAFQNGLRDCRDRGIDPRLFIGVAPTNLYPVTWRNLPASQFVVAQERMFQLGPWCGGCKLLFPLMAAEAAQQGRTAEARLWRQRGDDARDHSLSIYEPMATLWVDRPLRWAAAAILAAFLFAAALFTKYFSRGRDDIALRRSQEGPGGNYRFLRVEYWSWTERINFLLIVALGWAALGIAGAHYRAWRRFQEIPPQSTYGSFAGPDFAAFLQRTLPATPERELLLEINRRQSGGDPQPLVLPTPAQMERAFLGGGVERFPLWALGGPLTASRLLGDYWLTGSVARVLPVIYAFLLPLAFASFLMPQWPPLLSGAGIPACRLSPAEKKSGRQGRLPHWQWIREALVPGVSARWSLLGGLLLLAWCQELVKILMRLAWGSSDVYSLTYRPGMENFWRFNFGYAGAFPSALGALEIYGAAAAIWLVNLLVVSIFRRRVWEHGGHGKTEHTENTEGSNRR